MGSARLLRLRLRLPLPLPSAQALVNVATQLRVELMRQLVIALREPLVLHSAPTTQDAAIARRTQSVLINLGEFAKLDHAALPGRASILQAVRIRYRRGIYSVALLKMGGRVFMIPRMGWSG